MARLMIQPPGGIAPVAVQLTRGAGGAGAAGAREADHWQVELDGRKLEVQLQQTAAGRGWIGLHGRFVPFYVLQRDGQIQVWISGRVHTLALVQPTARRALAGEAGPASEQLTAPMPGTVLDIKVPAGEPFKAHQPLIILESMKMEMSLSVPHAGRVKHVACQVGQLVPMGLVLATLEPLAGE